MELRLDQASLNKDITKLKEQNKELQNKVVVLESKCFDDSGTIIRQLDEKKNLKRQLQAANNLIKKYMSNLKSARQLFKSTVEVKLQYEQVIAKLFSDEFTKEKTLDAVFEAQATQAKKAKRAKFQKPYHNRTEILQQEQATR